MKTFSQFLEDMGAVANTTANVVGTGDDKSTPVIRKKSDDIIVRRTPMNKKNKEGQE